MKDRNCGQCEKCVRTKLNFLAVGEPVPACFPDSNILEDLSHIKIKNEAIRSEWQQIYNYALANNIEGLWLKKVERILNTKNNVLLNRFFAEESLPRKIVKKLKVI